MTLGWDAAWQAARMVADPDATLEPVRIVAEHRGAYHAMAPDGSAAHGHQVAWVELPGTTFHRAGDKRALPTVGDWVLVERWPDAVAAGGAAVVRVVLPRRSFLVRRAAGEATSPQPLVANVETGIVMTSANADLSPARLDRYVGLLRDGGIEPVIAISKLDLVADPAPLLDAARSVVAAGPRGSRAPGDPATRAAGSVVGVSVVTGAGLDELRALAGPGRTCVLLGSSGVGKSSLLNLLAGVAQPIGDIRGDERGRHTTTRRELFVGRDGGMWIDTPGMRELAQWIDDADEAAFDDIAALAARCRFRDCRHRDEPGCAVRDAVPAPRLASFHKLADERRANAARQDAARRLAETRRARGSKRRKPDPA